MAGDSQNPGASPESTQQTFPVIQCCNCPHFETGGLTRVLADGWHHVERLGKAYWFCEACLNNILRNYLLLGDDGLSAGRRG